MVEINFGEEMEKEYIEFMCMSEIEKIFYQVRESSFNTIFSPTYSEVTS